MMPEQASNGGVDAARASAPHISPCPASARSQYCSLDCCVRVFGSFWGSGGPNLIARALNIRVPGGCQ